MNLHIAHACNIQCTYCFAHGGHYGRAPKLMTAETARAAVAWAIAESRPTGRCLLVFFGGEPLLNLELIREIVPFARQAAKDAGVELQLGMTTNGTLLTAEVRKYLMEEGIAIEVSVDGTAGHQNGMRTFHDGSGTYETVAENVKALTRDGACVTLRATVTGEDVEKEGIVEHLRELGTENVVTSPVVAHPSASFAIREEHLPVLRRPVLRVTALLAPKVETAAPERADNLARGDGTKGAVVDRHVKRPSCPAPPP